MSEKPPRERPAHQTTSLVLAVFLLAVVAVAARFLLFGDNPGPTGETPGSAELPVADQAGGAHAKSSTQAIVRFKLEWNDDPETAKKELDTRMRQIAEKLKAAGDEKWPQTAVTLAAPRRLRYGVFVHAIVAGSEQRLWRFNFACVRAAGADEVHHLRFQLPYSGPGFAGDEKPDMHRLRITKHDNDLSYELDGGPKGLEIDAALKSLKAAEEPSGRVVLILQVDPALTTQEFIDIYNAALKVGIKRISLQRPGAS